MFGGGPGGRMSGGGGGGGRSLRSMLPDETAPPTDSEGVEFVVPPEVEDGKAPPMGETVEVPPVEGATTFEFIGLFVAEPISLEGEEATGEFWDPVRRGTNPAGKRVEDGPAEVTLPVGRPGDEPRIPLPAREVPDATRLASHGGKVGVVFGRGGITRGCPGACEAVGEGVFEETPEAGLTDGEPFDSRSERLCEESPKRTVRVSFSKSKVSMRKSSSVFWPMVTH